MTRVLKPILKLLSRPVVCAPLKVLEINIYLVLLFIFQVYSRREVQVAVSDLANATGAVAVFSEKPAAVKSGIAEFSEIPAAAGTCRHQYL